MQRTGAEEPLRGRPHSRRSGDEIFEKAGQARISNRRAGQEQRMHANGRLTAPPQTEAVLVTDSVVCISPLGRSLRPIACGKTLDRSSQALSSLMRFVRPGGRGRLKFDTVSATPLLSATGEAAAGA